MQWFENFGIAMVRSTNLLVFLSIVFVGVMYALGTFGENAAFAIAGLLGAFLVAGLVTGLMSLVIQIYEQQCRQVELLKSIADKGE